MLSVSSSLPDQSASPTLEVGRCYTLISGEIAWVIDARRQSPDEVPVRLFLAQHGEWTDIKTVALGLFEDPQLSEVQPPPPGAPYVVRDSYGFPVDRRMPGQASMQSRSIS